MHLIFIEASQQDCLGHSPNHGLDKTNFATLDNERYKSKFVSRNVTNLSSLNLISNSLLFKGLKFVPTPMSVNKAIIKEELEACRRKRRLLWYFGNDERKFSYDLFKKKSKFDSKRRDAAIELYLSRLEEEISSLDYKVGILI